MRHGLTDDEIHGVTMFDPWFLARIREIVETEERIRRDGLPVTEDRLRALKSMGFTDARLATLTGRDEDRHVFKVPSLRMVAHTAFLTVGRFLGKGNRAMRVDQKVERIRR